MATAEGHQSPQELEEVGRTLLGTSQGVAPPASPQMAHYSPALLWPKSWDSLLPTPSPPPPRQPLAPPARAPAPPPSCWPPSRQSQPRRHRCPGTLMPTHLPGPSLCREPCSQIARACTHVTATPRSRDPHPVCQRCRGKHRAVSHHFSAGSVVSPEALTLTSSLLCK